MQQIDRITINNGRIRNIEEYVITTKKRKQTEITNVQEKGVHNDMTQNMRIRRRICYNNRTAQMTTCLITHEPTSLRPILKCLECNATEPEIRISNLNTRHNVTLTMR